jgi:hypothetical protein
LAKHVAELLSRHPSLGSAKEPNYLFDALSKPMMLNYPRRIGNVIPAVKESFCFDSAQFSNAFREINLQGWIYLSAM